MSAIELPTQDESQQKAQSPGLSEKKEFSTYDIRGTTDERIGMHALRSGKRSCSMAVYLALGDTRATDELELVVSTRIDGGKITDPALWDVPLDDRGALWHDRYLRVDKTNAEMLIAELQKWLSYDIDEDRKEALDV